MYCLKTFNLTPPKIRSFLFLSIMFINLKKWCRYEQILRNAIWKRKYKQKTGDKHVFIINYLKILQMCTIKTVKKKDNQKCLELNRRITPYFHFSDWALERTSRASLCVYCACSAPDTASQHRYPGQLSLTVHPIQPRFSGRLRSSTSDYFLYSLPRGRR